MLGCTTSKVVKKKKKKVDILRNLAPEMVENICLYLTPSEVFEVWNSNPRWRYQIMNDYFWKRKCRVDNVLPREESKITDVLKKLNNRFDYWYSTYYYDYALKNNWKNNLYVEIPVEEISSLESILLHYFNDKIIIVSAIPSDKLYVINSSTGVVEKTFPLDTQSGCARKFIIKKFDDKLLLFTPLNVVLWNFHTGELLMTKRFEDKIRTKKIRIHKNLIGFITCNPQNHFYIFNMDTQNIEPIAVNIKIFYFYENLGILLTINGLIYIFKIDNVNLVNHICPMNHYISGMLLKDKYLIVLCEEWHMTTWTIDHIGQSLTKLISYSIIDCIPNRGDYRELHKFILLDDNKIGYQIEQYSKFYVWDFLKGMYFFSMDINKVNFEKKVGNQLVLLPYNSNYPGYGDCQVWCLKTGKLIRTFELVTNSYLTQTKVIHFSETKLLGINNDNVLAIRDFDKKIKIDT